MRLGEGLRPARLVRRLNRFLAEVDLDGSTCQAHVPNSGRLGELLAPGTPVTLAAAGGGARRAAGRRTGYDLVAVVHRGTRVCIDARLPGPLLAEAIGEGRLAAFRGCRVARREVPLGESRLDLVLVDPEGRAFYVETKSVTLVRGGTALFPDAPTPRGARHLLELARASAGGLRAAAVFVVQREDAGGWAPNEETDPRFAQALRAAARAGVEVRAVRCRVGESTVAVVDEIPVFL